MKNTITREIKGFKIKICNPKDLGIGTDGYMYQGDIHVNGKMIGTIRDNGDGGYPSFYPNNKDASMLFRDLDKICMKLEMLDGFAGFCAKTTAVLLDSMDRN